MAMSPRPIAQETEYYVYIGQLLNPTLPESIIHIENPSYQLYSPRTTNLTNTPIVFRDRTKVYFYTHPDNYKNIYEFILACRASKNTENFYLMKMVSSVRELKELATKPYNLVSGEKLPALNSSERHLVHRYMLMGLHVYWTYVKCGLCRTKIVTSGNQSRIVSSGGHRFAQDEGFAVNVSLLFPAILIDYYRIESGTMGMNAQLSFTKDPEFRYLVYRYMRDVFFAFVKHNLPSELRQNEQLIARLETVGALTDEEIIKYAGNIIRALIA